MINNFNTLFLLWIFNKIYINVTFENQGNSQTKRNPTKVGSDGGMYAERPLSQRLEQFRMKRILKRKGPHLQTTCSTAFNGDGAAGYGRTS